MNISEIEATPAYGPDGEPDGWTDREGHAWAPLDWHKGGPLPDGTPTGRIGVTEVFDIDYASAVYAAEYLATPEGAAAQKAFQAELSAA